jgi:2-methylcitrate dehydratase
VGLVRGLAEEALARSYDDLPPDEVHQVKRLLLDSLACALPGRDSATAAALLASLDDLGGRAEATVWVGGERTTALTAALVNGAMLRYLDLNDVGSSPVAPGPRHGHNSEIFPIVLALAERQGRSGRDVLTAAWLGYEFSTRFTEAIQGRSFEARGWNLDTRASFVVPIVAGWLLGLDAERIEDAVGIALSRGMVLEVMDHPAEVNSMAKNLRYPLTGHLGVVATYLARHGLTGPDRALEGGDGFVERVLDGEFDYDHLLDRTPAARVMQAGMKRFAACFATHGHLHATLDLVLAHDLRPEQVASVHVRTTTRGARHTGDPSRRHPDNKETADHSSYYVQAALIVDRRLGPAQYGPEKLRDPRIHRIADRVTIEGDPAFDDIYPSARVTIRLTDGSEVERYVDHPLGHPANPFTDADIEAKFRDLAGPYLSDAAMERTIQEVWSLDRAPDLSGLLSHLVADRGGRRAPAGPAGRDRAAPTTG